MAHRPEDVGVNLRSENAGHEKVTKRILELQAVVQTLTITSSTTGPPIGSRKLQTLLEQARISTSCTTCQACQELAEDERYGPQDHSESTHEHDLEWLLVGKATAHTYGLVLSELLDQATNISEDIWYWEDILGSYRYTALYSIQTSPWRLWDWSKEVYHDVTRTRPPHVESWGQFYRLVKNAVDTRLKKSRESLVSPLAIVRSDVKRKQANVRRVKELNANALGILLAEGLSHDSLHGDGLATPQDVEVSHERRHVWKGTIARNIALMEAVLKNLVDPDMTVDKFESGVSATREDDRFYLMSDKAAGEVVALTLKPGAVSRRIQQILQQQLPRYQSASKQAIEQHGQPSWVVRYWLPATALVLSSTTILRIVTNRKAEIVTWLHELGATTIDFFRNWVIEPTRKVIGTIRHDEASEVSIMSKRSLEGDRASLERMVVDFAVDNPEKEPLTQADIEGIRMKIKEGDLTTVLKAYEKDLQKPFVGAVRGNLIRALLIQIQKPRST